MEDRREADILHPLATMKWNEYDPLPFGLRESAQCVLVNGRVCVGSECTVHLASADLKSWRKMVTRAHDFALATYDSQAVTIGGLDSACDREITNKSWVIDFKKNECLASSIPDMLTKRHSASAIHVESAMCLVVAGGADDKAVIDTVEVMLNGSWSYVQSLPTQQFGLRAAVHDANLFFVGDALCDVYRCNMDGILQACADPESKLKNPSSLWSCISSSLCKKKIPASFGNHLVIVGTDRNTSANEIQAFSSNTRPNPWVSVADLPNGIKIRASITLPTGELLVMRSQMKNVFKGVLEMLPFNPEDNFSFHALSKLEAAGIPVLTTLTKITEKLRETILEDEVELKGSQMEYVKTILMFWTSGKSLRAPTWRSLLDVLQELHEVVLSERIMDYLCAASRTTRKTTKTPNPKRSKPSNGNLTSTKYSSVTSELLTSTPRRSGRIRNRPQRYEAFNS